MSSTNAAAIAASVVEQLGGRYSTELGIDLDADDEEVERWFLAATLFGARISAQIAARTFHELERAGIRRIADADKFSRDDLIVILDAGGYARYDFRTATRLEDLAKVVTERYDGTVAEFGRRYTDPGELEGALGELPGWGAVTVGLFLRELRGVWPGAQPPLDAAGGGSGTPPGSDRARHEGRARTHHPPCRAGGMRRPRSRVRSGPARARPPPDGRLPRMPSVRRPRSRGAGARSRRPERPADPRRTPGDSARRRR